MGTRELRPRLLGEKLKQIRTDFNLSQNELLKNLGFDGMIFQGNISQYELGRREPPLPVLLGYARLAGVSVEVLIDDELDLPTDLSKQS